MLYLCPAAARNPYPQRLGATSPIHTSRREPT